MEKERANVLWFTMPEGIVCSCGTCHKIFSKGTWAVGVLVGERKYVVGVSPRITCCGNEQQVIDCSDTQAEAEALSQRVADQINRDGDISNLVLYENFLLVSRARPTDPKWPKTET